MFIVTPIALVGILSAAAVLLYNRRKQEGVLTAEEVKPLESATPNPVHNTVGELEGGPAGEEKKKVVKDAIDDEI